MELNVKILSIISVDSFRNFTELSGRIKNELKAFVCWFIKPIHKCFFICIIPYCRSPPLFLNVTNNFQKFKGGHCYVILCKG